MEFRQIASAFLIQTVFFETHASTKIPQCQLNILTVPVIPCSKKAIIFRFFSLQIAFFY